MKLGDVVRLRKAHPCGSCEWEVARLGADIGLEWEKRILLNYLELFENIKSKLNLSFSDITFNNFKNIREDFEKYLPG